MGTGFNQSKGKYKSEMRKKECGEIGILTWHQYDNFGSALQAAALVKTITDLGYEVSIINYRKKGDYSTLQIILRQIVGSLLQHLPYTVFPGKRYNFLRFRERYLKQTRAVGKQEIAGLLANCRVVVCGSDQIWAPNVLDTVYMGDFTGSECLRKVSYAASIGLNDIPDELVGIYRKLLSEFSFISVREDRGRVLLKEKCNIDSTLVIDPTLVIDKESYINIEKRVHPIEEEFVFCYFLSSKSFYKEAVIKYAEERNLHIYGITNEPTDNEWMSVISGAGPQEFIWLIHNAHTVFTDSYHGTIFSIIFQKNFYTFKRFSNDDPVNQNSRIYQLDKYFGIGSRFLSSDNTTLDKPELDFNSIEKQLVKLREVAKSFLINALEK